jgi:hypothetical protein
MSARRSELRRVGTKRHSSQQLAVTVSSLWLSVAGLTRARPSATAARMNQGRARIFFVAGTMVAVRGCPECIGTYISGTQDGPTGYGQIRR